MAATHYGARDWMFGYSANVTLSNGNTEPAYLAGVVLSDSAGVEYGTGNPLPVSATISGTGAVNLAQVAGTNTVTAGVSGLLATGGNVAAGVTDTGNPLKIGGKVESNANGLGPWTAGQRGDVWLTTTGAVMIGGGAVTQGDNRIFNPTTPIGQNSSQSLGWYSVPQVFNGTGWDRQRGNTTGTIVIPPSGWQYAAAASGIVNTTTAVTIKTAAGANVRNYVSAITIQTNGALGAATEVAIRDGAGGTVLWRGYIGTAGLGMTSISFDNPLVGSTNTLLEFVTLTASVTGAVYLNAQGYTGA